MIEDILDELNYDTVSFRDEDGNWFEGIDKSNFGEVADRLEKLFSISVVSNRKELLFAFIKDWKDEFKDENWDYLDFMAERFLSKQ